MMVVIEKEKRSVVLSVDERKKLREDLETAYNVGGRYISIQYNKNLANYLMIYDDNKNKTGKIVGNSAILLSEILGKSEDNVFMSVPISIESIIKEYC